MFVHYLKYFVLLFLSGGLFGLSGCGMIDFPGNSEGFQAYKVDETSPQDTSDAGKAQMEEIPEAAPLAETLEDTQTRQPAVPDLFAQELSSESARLDRLETVVQNLYKTLSMRLPPANRTQQNTGASAPTPLVSVATPQNPTAAIARPAAASSPQKSAQQTQGDSSNQGIANIRISEQSGKTRIVFDSTRAIDFSIDYDESENFILVTAANTSLKTDYAERAKQSKLIHSLSTSNDDGNASIVLTLNDRARLTPPRTIPPNKDSRFYRTFFDLTP